MALPTGELDRDGQRPQYGASTDYKLLVSGSSVGIARRTDDYPGGMTWELMTHLQWDSHDDFRAWLQETNSDVVFKEPTPRSAHTTPSPAPRLLATFRLSPHHPTPPNNERACTL